MAYTNVHYSNFYNIILTCKEFLIRNQGYSIILYFLLAPTGTVVAIKMLSAHISAR